MLVHEQYGLGQEATKGCSFENIIAETPRSLQRAKLYCKIAVPLKGGIYRNRSLVMLAEVLLGLNALTVSRSPHLLASTRGLTLVS